MKCIKIQNLIKAIKSIQLAKINIEDEPLFKKGHWYFYNVEYGLLLSPFNYSEYYFWLGATKNNNKIIKLGNKLENFIYFIPSLLRYYKNKI